MDYIRGTMFSLIFKIWGDYMGGIYGRERVSDYTFSLPSLSLFSAPVPPSPCLHSPSYMPQSPITKLLKYQISQIKINKAYL